MSRVNVDPAAYFGFLNHRAIKEERGSTVRLTSKTLLQQIQEQLGPNYVVESTPSGKIIAKAKPVKYVAERKGSKRTYATYSPDELIISSKGEVLQETKRGIYKQDVFKHGQRQAVYEKEIINYKKQSRYTYGTRDLKSGRETIKQTSSLEHGSYREKRIIHQDSKEYRSAHPEQKPFVAPKEQFRTGGGAALLHSSKDVTRSQMIAHLSMQQQMSRDAREYYANTVSLVGSNKQKKVVQEKPAHISEVAPKDSRLDAFEKMIKSSQKRQADFLGSENFANVRKTARWMTGGYTDIPFEQRSFLGKASEYVAFGVLGTSIMLGGLIPMVGEKLFATGEALTFKQTRKNILPELYRAGKITLKTTLNPLTPEGFATYTSAFVFGAFGMSQARTSAPVRWGMQKLYPNKYISLNKVNIQFVEGQTIPTTTKSLQALEGKTVPTIHATVAKLPWKNRAFVTKAQPSGAGSFRTANQLYHFYKSAPQAKGSVMTPRAYLGYTGIGKAASSNPKIIYGKPVPILLMGKDYISLTPKTVARGSLHEVNVFQGQQSGKTFVPAENIKGFSMEGQLITPAKYSGIRGYESFHGSIIQKSGPAKFTYYEQQLTNPYQNPVARLTWDLLAKKKEHFKIEMQSVKTLPVDDLMTHFSTASMSKLDITKYNLESSKGYRYVQPSRIRGISVFSPSRSMTKQIYSSPNSQSPSQSIISSPRIYPSLSLFSISSNPYSGKLSHSSPNTSPPGTGRSSGVSPPPPTLSHPSMFSLTSSPAPSHSRSVTTRYAIGLFPANPPGRIRLPKTKGSQKERYNPLKPRKFKYTADVISSSLEFSKKISKKERKKRASTGMLIRPLVM